MKSVTWLLSVGLATAAVASDRPLREARSENGRYALRIDAGRPGRGGRPCRAMLHDSRAERSGRRVWERMLVNETAPRQGFVRDDGRFVVTLDEHSRGGARNALVIYGAEGELLRHFLLPDLLERDDWARVKVQGEEVVWLEGASAGFASGSEHSRPQPAPPAAHEAAEPADTAVAGEFFVVRLRWGREVRVDLRTLQVVRGGKSADSAVADVPPEILARLLGHARAQSENGADLPLSATVGTQTAADEISAALAPDDVLPESLTGEPAAVPEVPREPSTGEAAVAEVDANDADAGQPIVPPEPAASGSEEDARGRSPCTTVTVPRPQPGEKVDYVAWLNGYGQVQGPDAAPFYEAAIAQLPEWTGDRELLIMATGGDPAALASPAVAAWLEQCAGALELLRQGAQQPVRGWHYESPDGTLIGVVLPLLGQFRELSRAHLIAARQELAAGRPGPAAGRCLDVRAAGAHAGAGLTLIESLVGLTVQSLGGDTLLDIQHDAADALDFVQLAADVRRAYRRVRDPAETLQGERALFMDTLQRSWDVDPAGGEPVLNRAAAARLLKTAEMDDAQIAETLDRLERIGYGKTEAEASIYYDALTEAFSRPFAEGRRQLEKIEQIMTDPQMNPLLRTFIPALARCQFLYTRTETARRAVLTVTQLNAYRQQHGEYPDSLEVLGDDEATTDPFTGRRFQYRRTPAGFTLYSRGANGVDDGGVHDHKGQTGDVVFWPRPAK